jgi:Tol biopolymer transport system component
MRTTHLLLLASLGLAACSSRSATITALGLRGELVYTQGAEGLWEIDLESGEVGQLWKLPEGGHLSGVSVSPDGLDLAIAYSPPNPSAVIPRTDLYLANRDGSGAQPLMVHSGVYETFDHPTWSPDGQWLYFTRSDILINEDQTFSDLIVNIERVPSGGGTSQTVMAGAEQPAISADGSRLAFLRFNLETYTRSLWVANIDGADATMILPDSRFFDLSVPRFSPDGQTLAFAGSEPLLPEASERRSFWSWLFGVVPAYAHGPPWDFWTIPIIGGVPMQITDWVADGAALAWSPDGDHLALMHLSGLFVTGEGEPTLLVETPNHGGLVWIDGS